MEQLIAANLDDNNNFTLGPRVDSAFRQVLRLERWCEQRTGHHQCRIYFRINVLFEQLLTFILNNDIFLNIEAVEERISEIRDCISARRLIRRQQRRLQHSRR